MVRNYFLWKLFFIEKINKLIQKLRAVNLWCHGIPENVISIFDSVFDIFLIQGLQKYARN